MGTAGSTTRRQRRTRDPSDGSGIAAPALHARHEYTTGASSASVAAPPRYRPEAHRAADTPPTQQSLNTTITATTHRFDSPLLGLVDAPSSTTEQGSVSRLSGEARHAAARRGDAAGGFGAPTSPRGRLPGSLVSHHAASAPVRIAPALPDLRAAAADTTGSAVSVPITLNSAALLLTPPRSPGTFVPMGRGVIEAAASSVGGASRSVFRSVQSVHGLICSPAENSLVRPNPVRPQVVHVVPAVDAYITLVNTLLHTWHAVCERFEEFLTELRGWVIEEHPELLRVFTSDNLNGLVRAVVVVVSEPLMLTARPEELSSTLLQVSALHERFHVGEADLAAVRDAFMSILPKYLPADLQDTYAAAWEPHWRAVIELIMHGSRSSRGDWHAVQQRMAHLMEARCVMSDILMQLQLSARAAFVQQMVDGAIERDASMTRVAMLRERRVSIAAFHEIVRFLRACGDTVSADALMDELVPVYSPMGLDVAALRAFRQPFIDTCEAVALRARGLDQWGPSMPQSLGVLWDSLTQTWEQALMRAEEVRITQEDRAPDGSEPFCLMLLDIEGSTRLWERNRAAMASALAAYQSTVRNIISDFGAYEVKAVGDSFVIAAKDVLVALRVAVTVQLKLMRGPIAKGFEMVPNPQGGGSADCWRADSLRVRIGIHYCRDASAVYDSVQRRYDYYGPSVNCAAHTAAAACGGQILMTQEALEVLQGMPAFNSGMQGSASSSEDRVGQKADANACALRDVRDGVRPLAELVTVRDWGHHSFKDIDHRIRLASIVPKTLDGRVFPRSETLFLEGMTLPLFNTSLTSSAASSVSCVLEGEGEWGMT